MRHFAALCLALVPIAAAAGDVPLDPADRIFTQVRGLEITDERTKVPEGGVVFVGGPDIRMWDVDRFFKGLKPLKRTHPDIEAADVSRHLGRLVLRHKPRAVVLYVGEEDVVHGRTPEEIAEAFAAIVKRAREERPEMKVIAIGIKPSPARWELTDTMRRANELMAAVARKHENVRFVDLWSWTMGADGKPDQALFAADDLHFRDGGYLLWTDEVKKQLAE